MNGLSEGVGSGPVRGAVADRQLALTASRFLALDGSRLVLQADGTADFVGPDGEVSQGNDLADFIAFAASLVPAGELVGAA